MRRRLLSDRARSDPDRVAQVITESSRFRPSDRCRSALRRQNRVLHDMVGLFDRFTAEFVKRYANCWDVIAKAWAISKKT